MSETAKPRKETTSKGVVFFVDFLAGAVDSSILRNINSRILLLGLIEINFIIKVKINLDVKIILPIFALK